MTNLSQKERNDIIQWDVKNWQKCLSFWDKNASIPPNKKVLALGEREGGLSLYFALKGHTVICSDYNPLPDTTKNLHDSYGVSDQITYRKIDMKAIDLANDSIDIVVFKSVIGALGNADDQHRAMNEIYRVLKPGGHLLFAENLTGGFLHRFMRKHFVGWGKRWRYVTEKEMCGAAPFSAMTTDNYGIIALFGRSEKQRRILAGVDRILTPISPKKWRYILFGAFKK